ncbi:DUF4294 domain-containing protein [Aurantibacillus circumpalustris]|uniref:DUF4294 domain-containing protein n=1 Tax=Aurantibacillus circumpalustris TaxID=3036359 RepID=UPI00295ACEDE|nr:DUF4294 domain-containing protein [Aurantibacillus circumpalustris]
MDRFKPYSKVHLALFYASSFVFGSFSLFSQSTALANDILTPLETGFRCRTEIVGLDTFPLIVCDEVEIITNFIFTNNRQKEQWTKIKFNVKKVYPYAILAAAKLKEYDRALEKIKDEKLKKTFLKVCEKDLRSEFEDELSNLSVSQGKILMKLIDRETEKTTYEIVKQLRGGFQAAMWQTVARIFGHNMKTKYDARVEDLMVERAVKLVEAGQF